MERELRLVEKAVDVRLYNAIRAKIPRKRRHSHMVVL